MIGQAVRSLLFFILFLAQTVVLAIVVGGLCRLFGRTGLAWALIRYWNHSTLFLVRWLGGIRSIVTGQENIPPGGCIIAAKHQSDWDVFAILPHIGRPSFIAKKELMVIPFFGWAARTYDTISIDRSKGGEAIPAMLEEARQKLALGCRIIIFPEGTRTRPLADPAYKFGIAKMYAALGVPVVPVALNSGLFWGRNSLLLWRGKARAQFLPAIAPGLAPEDFLAQLAAAIEPATESLILTAVEEGLARPIDPALRERLDALEDRAAGTAAP